MKLEEAKKLQNLFKSDLNEISRGRHKSKEQKKCIEKYWIALQITRSCYKLFNDYSSVVSEAKCKSIYGERLKILTQMLQRLPIALAQVKASNTSENLLNEIRQIIYHLHQAKEIIKIVYNDTMNSIKS